MPNDKNPIGIITSYPAKNGEIAGTNAISRYSYLLTRSFPVDQNLVVLCETSGKASVGHQFSKNILVLPTYKFNSLNFAGQILKSALNLTSIKDYLIQFEFSIFGGKKIIPSFLLMLAGLKILGKNVTITLHQVATNLNELSGHLGLKKNSIEIYLLNLGLNIFYKSVGLLSSKIIVHDDLLKLRLSKYINPEKIDVIPHAIGDESVKRVTSGLKDVAKKQFGFSKKDRIVTVYGYRSWYKGTDWIINAVKEISKFNPKLNLKLLVAGGESPTLRETMSYKKFDRKLKNVIKKAGHSVKVTGFVPEKDVWKVFAASDVVVFPYRTRMSASGAYSLALAYKRPFIVSNHFATGSEVNFTKNTFDMNTFSFENVLKRIISNKRLQKSIVSESTKFNNQRSWSNIANLYLLAIKNANINLYDDVFSKKTYQLAQN